MSTWATHKYNSKNHTYNVNCVMRKSYFFHIMYAYFFLTASLTTLIAIHAFTQLKVFPVCIFIMHMHVEWQYAFVPIHDVKAGSFASSSSIIVIFFKLQHSMFTFLSLSYTVKFSSFYFSTAYRHTLCLLNQREKGLRAGRWWKCTDILKHTECYIGSSKTVHGSCYTPHIHTE